MKKTDIDNPEILVKDKRILEIDEIVTEVKESEEWEGIEMNILEIGIQEGEKRGREQGIQQGIQAVIEVCKSIGNAFPCIPVTFVVKFLYKSLFT